MHVAQLMPLPLTVSCFSKIQIGFTFLVPAHLGSPRKGPLNGCVCVCVCVISKRYLYFNIGNGQPREPALLPIVSTHFRYLLLLCAMLLQCLVTATVDRCRLPPMPTVATGHTLLQRLIDGADRRREGRTPYRYIDLATYCASSVNNGDDKGVSDVLYDMQRLQKQDIENRTRKDGRKEANISKNRYKNILPCEYSVHY